MTILYLGPEGSFSHAAALQFQGQFGVAPQLTPLPSIDAVVRAIAGGPAEGNLVALVPYYNFLEGLVQEHLDLIYEFKLCVTGITRLPIRLCAGGFAAPGAPEFEVLSHPKALAQTSDFIYAKYSNAIVKSSSSTSEAARLVREQRHGVAIASEDALKKFELPILAKDIGNIRHGKSNFTDFFIVRHPRDVTPAMVHDSNHSLVAITPQINRPGLLSELLGQFHFYGMDIAKIHSRPAIDAVDLSEEPQMFYLEVKCAPSAESLVRCADAIGYKFEVASQPEKMFRILGGFRI